MDSVTPLRMKRTTAPLEPWLNDSICTLRCVCKQAERRSKKDKVSYEILLNRLSDYQKALKSEKQRVSATTKWSTTAIGNPPSWFTTMIHHHHNNRDVVLSTMFWVLINLHIYIICLLICLHWGSERNGISIPAMSCTYGRIEYKVDFDTIHNPTSWSITTIHDPDPPSQSASTSITIHHHDLWFAIHRHNLWSTITVYNPPSRSMMWPQQRSCICKR